MILSSFPRHRSGVPSSPPPPVTPTHRTHLQCQHLLSSKVSREEPHTHTSMHIWTYDAGKWKMLPTCSTCTWTSREGETWACCIRTAPALSEDSFEEWSARGCPVAHTCRTERKGCLAPLCAAAGQIRQPGQHVMRHYSEELHGDFPVTNTTPAQWLRPGQVNTEYIYCFWELLSFPTTHARFKIAASSYETLPSCGAVSHGERTH